MKQSENRERFFDKYGFTQSIEMNHPEFKDRMFFEGLEAHYVTLLQRQIVNLEKMIQHQAEKLDWLRDREFCKFKEKPVDND